MCRALLTSPASFLWALSSVHCAHAVTPALTVLTLSSHSEHDSYPQTQIQQMPVLFCPSPQEGVAQSSCPPHWVGNCLKKRLSPEHSPSLAQGTHQGHICVCCRREGSSDPSRGKSACQPRGPLESSTLLTCLKIQHLRTSPQNLSTFLGTQKSFLGPGGGGCIRQGLSVSVTAFFW